MSEMNRREALALIAIAPFAAAPAARAARPAPAAAQAAPTAEPEPRNPDLHFFTPQEFALVTVLADLVLPADDRSGSASQVGVPQFMDYILGTDSTTDNLRLGIRGGLGWMDAESRRRYERPFLELTDPEQTAILDDIAWPARARPEMSHGVVFFSRFRDMVASAFWSTEIGVRDLQYLGNVPVFNWDGCPPAVLQKLGVSGA
jgi:gluconate 2-dehydrogenase gamma chain